MKNAYFRLKDIWEINKPYQQNKEMIEKEKQLIDDGYIKLFDTINTHI